MISYRTTMLVSFLCLYVVGWFLGGQSPVYAYGTAWLVSAFGSVAACMAFDQDPDMTRRILAGGAACLITLGGMWMWFHSSGWVVPAWPALTLVASLMLLWAGGPGRMPFVLLGALMLIGGWLVVAHHLVYSSSPGPMLGQLAAVSALTVLEGLALSLLTRASG